MFGYNEGFVWSLLNRPGRHYRRFEIPKGKMSRTIHAPRVGLKTIQKWLATHLQRNWKNHDAVFGFVPGRSHLDAAHQHLGAAWIVSIDVKDFFPSTSTARVSSALSDLGYHDLFSKRAIVSLTCLAGGLAQGSPCSPILSNIVLHDLDIRLADFAKSKGLVYTRYADDLVVSGKKGDPSATLAMLVDSVTNDGWTVAGNKTTVSISPSRLKVHGLLVHGDRIRLTKGYRNRIRAFRHLIDKGAVEPNDLARLSGHLEFANSVDRFNGVKGAG